MSASVSSSLPGDSTATGHDTPVYLPPHSTDGLVSTAFMGFRIGPLKLLAAWGLASESLEIPKIYRLPGTPESMPGLINLHGNVIPVFDMAVRFALTRSHDLRPTLVVLERGADASAFVIDGMPSRLRFTDEQAIDLDLAIGRLPVQALQPLVTGAFHQNDEIWFAFDHRRCIDELMGND